MANVEGTYFWNSSKVNSMNEVKALCSLRSDQISFNTNKVKLLLSISCTVVRNEIYLEKNLYHGSLKILKPSHASVEKKSFARFFHVLC